MKYIEKQCRICLRVKEPEDFCRDKRGYLQSYCKECDSERAREWRKQNPEKARASQRLRRFGITDEKFQELLSRQGGVCAICGAEFLDSPYIDHNHDTGEVRGLLCMKCNVLIGLAGEEPSVLHQAANYIENGGSEPS